MKTLAIIKPDVIKQGKMYQVLGVLEYHFIISGMKMTTLSKEQAEQFYAEHKGKPFFEDLVVFMSSGPIVAVALEGVDVVAKYRQWLVDVIRPTYGTSMSHNAAHGSDSEAAANRELAFFGFI